MVAEQVCSCSIFFWNVLRQNVFLRPFERFTVKTMAYSIMVVRQILVLFVLVRIQVGQQATRGFSCGFCFFRRRGELTQPNRQKNKTSPMLIWLVTWVIQCASAITSGEASYFHSLSMTDNGNFLPETASLTYSFTIGRF